MKVRKQDFMLIAAILLVGVILALVLFLKKSDGALVRVTVSGETVQTFSLSEDTTYLIQGKDGGTNQLVIENGEAYISEASCPDKLCVNMGRIHYDGQSVVCLPNEVVVSIEGGSKNAYDSVAQ